MRRRPPSLVTVWGLSALLLVPADLFANSPYGIPLEAAFQVPAERGPVLDYTPFDLNSAGGILLQGRYGQPAAAKCRVLFFTMQSCPPCEAAKADIRQQIQGTGLTFGPHLTDDIQLVEYEKFPDSIRQYGISSFPTFVTLDESNRILDRRTGYGGFSNLTAKLQPTGKLTAVRSLPTAFQPAESRLAVDGAAHTPLAEIVRVLSLLPKPEIGFVDFGCGYDARWCIAAAEKWACHVTGIELDPARAAAARERVKNLGLDHLITIVEGDALTADVRGDVAVVYLYPDVLAKLKSRLETFKAVASYMHQVPGLLMQRSGDSWIYRQPTIPTPQTYATVQISVPRGRAVWQGVQYSGPVCNSPGCRMCASIRSQLGQ